MALRQKILNLWNIIIILSLFLPSIKSHSDVCNVNHNKSCENSESNLLNLAPAGAGCNENCPKNFDISYAAQKIVFDYNEHYLNFSSDEISIACRNALDFVESRAKILDMNALKLLDSNAKVSSGVLQGNINNLGDFDECLDVKLEDFNGKYCLSEIHFVAHKHLQQFQKLILANEPYKNELNDITHIIPRSSTIFWGICVPSSCSHKDVEIALRNTVHQRFGKYLQSSQIKIKENNCQVHKESSWSSLTFGTKCSIIFFVLLFCVTGLATAYDVLFVGAEKNELLRAFSMTKNFKEIFSTELSPQEIPSLNGIRFFNTFMIIIGHKNMINYFVPWMNTKFVSNLYSSVVSIPSRAMFLHTEVFLMLSGLLLTHSLVGRLNRGVSINIKKEIAARYFRFMPPVIVLMLISTFILPLMGSGPMWPDIVGATSDICKANGWMNLFMIQNWFGFENICNFNLHHVGTDFILFVALLPMVVYLYKYPRYNIMAISILAVLSSIARFYVTYVTNVEIYLPFGTSIQQLLDTANYMYGIPPYRFTSFAIGIILGYILRNQKPKELGSKMLSLGWISAIASMIITIGISTSIHYANTRLKMAFLAAFGPILFCYFFAWIIYVSHHKSGNAFTRFFEWKYFKITSALSYAIYLIQFLVFFYKAGHARASSYYTIYNEMYDFNELAILFICAILMTLLVELPFGNIKKIIFDKKKPTPVKTD